MVDPVLPDFLKFFNICYTGRLIRLEYEQWDIDEGMWAIVQICRNERLLPFLPQLEARRASPSDGLRILKFGIGISFGKCN